MLYARLIGVEAQTSELKRDVSGLRDMFASRGERIAALETERSGMRDRLDRIERKLDQLLDERRRP